MTDNVIPLYSEGDQIGGVFVSLDGQMTAVQMTEVGTQQCASVLVNGLDYVFDLVPRNRRRDASSSGDISAQLTKDELVRKEAIELTAVVLERASEKQISPDSIAYLAKRIERFLKEGM